MLSHGQHGQLVHHHERLRRASANSVGDPRMVHVGCQHTSLLPAVPGVGMFATHTPRGCSVEAHSLEQSASGLNQPSCAMRRHARSHLPWCCGIRPRTSRCRTCHQMAHAGSHGQQGFPNLPSIFSHGIHRAYVHARTAPGRELAPAWFGSTAAAHGDILAQRAAPEEPDETGTKCAPQRS